MKDHLRWVFVAVTPACLVASPSLVIAQDAPPPPARQVCMASSPSDTPDGSVITIVVPPDQEAILVGRGFSDVPCSGSSADFTNYQTQICQLANNAPQPVLDQFNNTYGVAPRDLCDWANALATQ